MLKKAASFVLASLGTSTYRSKPTGGKVTIRSHMIEASGSSKLGMYLLAPSLVRGGRVKRRPFEHPEKKY
jgi:hypothetical protein